MTLISENIKFLRKRQGLTQEQMAERLGIKRSLLGAYEEGRAEPNLNCLLLLSKIFEVPVEAVIQEVLSQDNNLQKVKKKDIEGNKLRVLSVTLDKDERENIHLVPQKAAAGYLNGFSDPEYVSELPKFYMPIFTNGTYRAFEIKGDSMLPLPSGSIIIGQYVENWQYIKDDKTYVLVTNTEGIVYKRVYNHIPENETLRLVSDNKGYDPYDVNINEVSEIWEAKAFISTEFPKADISLEKLSSMMSHLQQELKSIKNK
jgi:transcriptional regulator with XRE-family HTH domain